MIDDKSRKEVIAKINEMEESEELEQIVVIAVGKQEGDKPRRIKPVHIMIAIDSNEIDKMSDAVFNLHRNLEQQISRSLIADIIHKTLTNKYGINPVATDRAQPEKAHMQ